MELRVCTALDNGRMVGKWWKKNDRKWHFMFIQLFFLMGCNAIKEDNTKVYVDSYSQTALQQADIIMDGIQSENCEEIADIFCTYIKKIIRSCKQI